MDGKLISTALHLDDWFVKRLVGRELSIHISGTTGRERKGAYKYIESDVLLMNGPTVFRPGRLPVIVIL